MPTESPDFNRAATVDARLAALRHGSELSARLCESFGPDTATFVEMTDDELREARYDELVADGKVRPS